MNISKKYLYEYLYENKKELLELFNGDKNYLKEITTGNTNIPICFNCINYKNCGNAYNVRSRDITRTDGKNHKGYCNSCKRKSLGVKYQKLIIEKNGSLLDKNPNITDIWSDKNNNKPEEICNKSHKSIYLKCPNKSKNHPDYSIKVYNIKHFQFYHCPKCVPHFSKCEVRIMTELQKIGFNVIHLSKIGGREADLLLPEIQLIIEVDGYPWHLNKEEKDSSKNKLFEELGYNVLRIRDIKLNYLECNKIICDVSNFHIEDFNKILYFINNNYNKNIQIIDVFDEKLYKENYLSCSYIKYEESIEYLYPQSINIWDYDNNIIKPCDVKPSSSEKIYIKCHNGHQRYRRISDVFTKNGITNCRYCLEFTINNIKYTSMTDCCNKLNISRTNLCRKMISANLDIKNTSHVKNFIENNYLNSNL